MCYINRSMIKIIILIRKICFSIFVLVGKICFHICLFFFQRCLIKFNKMFSHTTGT
ncbi:hypothetical protein Pint_33291 [Pistacia integerrima]|uniref:Uncharacterized protein n=1 Tax=Pistacia integerrima TaxID=434235 RepID=A0ACC0X6U1_9ROSI|nr:hypothetical protein Pint_33291 [Pistacia integerrima]